MNAWGAHCWNSSGEAEKRCGEAKESDNFVLLRCPDSVVAVWVSLLVGGEKAISTAPEYSSSLLQNICMNADPYFLLRFVGPTADWSNPFFVSNDATPLQLFNLLLWIQPFILS